MSINTSTIQRNLDAKLKIGNIEALDLLIALICGAIMNLFFSGTALELPLVIGMPMLILAVCYFGKRGKPEKFCRISYVSIWRQVFCRGRRTNSS